MIPGCEIPQPGFFLTEYGMLEAGRNTLRMIV